MFVTPGTSLAYGWSIAAFSSYNTNGKTSLHSYGLFSSFMGSLAFQGIYHSVFLWTIKCEIVGLYESYSTPPSKKITILSHSRALRCSRSICEAALTGVSPRAGFSGKVRLPPPGQARPQCSWGAGSDLVGGEAAPRLLKLEKVEAKQPEKDQWTWSEPRTRMTFGFPRVLAGPHQLAAVHQGEGEGPVWAEPRGWTPVAGQ